MEFGVSDHLSELGDEVRVGVAVDHGLITLKNYHISNLLLVLTSLTSLMFKIWGLTYMV